MDPIATIRIKTAVLLYMWTVVSVCILICIELDKTLR